MSDLCVDGNNRSSDTLPAGEEFTSDASWLVAGTELTDCGSSSAFKFEVLDGPGLTTAPAPAAAGSKAAAGEAALAAVGLVGGVAWGVGALSTGWALASPAPSALAGAGAAAAVL